ncbi:ribose-phosphate pyrophosphokinase-like domain-containing protein [Chromobacterium violaceum]|uniref:ribose-phosphate pyrophosphokinase-like domain-containing protein n=1 Tax=Chromobacterium violaceum TaxID=536 RepID=UPI001B334593|nr:ribose-phosphate pyrophosphokinase-like domain-containing protein [Chromobacterium violaceum]MBP4047551.1 ribose-phosphate pyrophosphokinase-like domain-containing protein [Chromobacterium violaceum]
MITVSYLTRDGQPQALKLDLFTFPGGEVHATAETGAPAAALCIRADLRDAGAIISLLMATDALRRAYPGVPLELCLPYVPYARQDRVANPGEALSAKVFCGLINQQGYSRVRIQDPHSDVVTALLDRVEVEDPLPALRRALEAIGPATLVAPDAGARKRVLKLAQQLGCGAVCADKARDTATGKISGIEVHGALPAGPLLVVDDICDGGGTFVGLAEAIAARQAAEGQSAPLYLYVTHGIFSRGLDRLLQHFDAVFARNDWSGDARCRLV